MARRLSLLAVPTAFLFLLPTPVAHASGGAPVTKPDAVTVTIDSRAVHIDLTANDVDPESERLSYAGTEGTDPQGVGIAGDRGSVEVYATTVPGPGDTTGATPGTYVVKTYVTDGTNLSASTLTITVLPSPMDAVTVTKKKRPGRLLVRNDNPLSVRYLWGAEDRKRADGRADIPAHSAVTIKVRRPSLVTLVVAGSDFGWGTVRHVKVPRNGAAPGAAHVHDLFGLFDVKWVMKVIRAFE